MKLCPCEQNLLKNILSYNPPSEVNFDDALTETVHFQDSQNYMQRFTRKDKVYHILESSGGIDFKGCVRYICASLFF